MTTTLRMVARPNTIPEAKQVLEMVRSKLGGVHSISAMCADDWEVVGWYFRKLEEFAVEASRIRRAKELLAHEE